MVTALTLLVHSAGTMLLSQVSVQKNKHRAGGAPDLGWLGGVCSPYFQEV